MDKALKKEEDALVESIRKKNIENNLLENKNKDLKDSITLKKQEIKSIKPEPVKVETIKEFKENTELQSQEDKLVESIRKKKVEENVLENKNKHLKDLNGVVGDQIPQELKDCEVNLEVKKQELSTVEKEIETANEISANAWSESIALDRSYKEAEESSNIRLEVLVAKGEKKKKEIIDDTDKLLKKKETGKQVVQDEVNKLEKDKTILTNLNQSLTNENMVTKNENTKLKKDNKTLENKKKVTEEESILEDKKAEIIKQDIKELEEKRKELTVDVKELTEEEEDEQKKLDRILRNADFLVRKEDNLKSYEAYIIDIAKRLGLDYQPFK